MALNRREMILGAGATATLGTMFGPYLWEGFSNSVRSETLKKDIAKLKYEIITRNSSKERPLELQATEHEVERFAKMHDGSTAELDPLRSLWILRSALENLKNELEKYPAGLIQARVKKIVLMEKLRGSQMREGTRGFAVPNNGEVYIGIPSLLRQHFTMANRALPLVTAHHELGHVFLGVEEETFKEWMKLNPPGFHYPLFLRPFRDRKEKPKGFADAYGQADPSEDMATVFERMILEPKTFPHQTDPGDTHLADKVRFIKNLLQKISPEMDDSFWAVLSKK